MGSYVICAVVMMILFGFLSSTIEARTKTVSETPMVGVQRSRRVVAKLAGLFALDAFAGGFIVQSIVAYWFYLRYKTDLNALGGIFFGTNLLAALSFLAAPAIARRFGLLNTMVFTHLPSNILLLLIPLMPNLELAVVMLLARNLLSQLDVPTRQSYTMVVVDPDERAASAGILSVARNAGADRDYPEPRPSERSGQCARPEWHAAPRGNHRWSLSGGPAARSQWTHALLRG